MEPHTPSPSPRFLVKREELKPLGTGWDIHTHTLVQSTTILMPTEGRASKKNPWPPLGEKHSQAHTHTSYAKSPFFLVTRTLIQARTSSTLYFLELKLID